MEYRNLGRSGLQVSVIGLGCMPFGMSIEEEASAGIVHRALELGINFFDTADIYGDRGKSEVWLGRALGKRRPEVVIATKFAGPMSSSRRDMQGGSRRYICAAVEGSLQRLGTDYIDLYQMHFPDAKTPVEETLRALDDLVRQGKVRYIGHSNYAGWQLVEADWTAKAHNLNAFVSAQNRWSLISRDIERELVPAASAYGISILPYFPLESGLLTGKYRKGAPPPEGSRLAKWGAYGSSTFSSEANFNIVEKFNAVCEKHGVSLLELAMAWLVAKPVVASVIAGVTSIGQLEQNVAAGLKKLPAAALSEAGQITAPPVAGFGPPRRS
ncbi:MAG: aldo/keto reductase [Gammaproteobacteria bacterium]|nr:aldo/keto reductase [Gammaproteobacteria bacterium]